MGFSIKKEWIATDGWRGYERPVYAVAGTSYTGESEDSPCSMRDIKPELQQIRAYLKENGIRTKQIYGKSSNMFMMKIWVIVPTEQFAKAKKLAKAWLKKHDRDLEYLHD